jgi:hypothetical protein
MQVRESERRIGTKQIFSSPVMPVVTFRMRSEELAVAEVGDKPERNPRSRPRNGVCGCNRNEGGFTLLGPGFEAF